MNSLEVSSPLKNAELPSDVRSPKQIITERIPVMNDLQFNSKCENLVVNLTL